MIKSNELRIGNLVKQGDVESIGGSLIQVSNTIYESERIEPIELTEKWLLKFGFKKSKVSSQFDKEKLTIQIANKLEYHKEGRVYFNSWAILEESIKYVHQLQNLYFALTGVELELSSNVA
jgi:hypothetical protein